ncbi:MAG: universal stress protein [Mycobacteriaceae bacterium]|nr:universal stress protein [Mycobacteriaceae bacterium]
MNDSRYLASAAVVVGVDGSAGAVRALRWATEVARQRDRELRIACGISVDERGSALGRFEVLVPALLDELRKDALHTLSDARVIASEQAPGLPISIQLSAAGPARLLIEESADAYLTVISASGRSAHFGSTVRAVAGHGHGPIVVVRQDADGQVRRTGPVVVGVDGSRAGEAAIAAAFDEAAERGAGLVAVHACNDLPFERYAGGMAIAVPASDLEEVERLIVAERLAGWQEKYPDVLVTRRLYFSDPVARLQQWSSEAQLVVVGSHGRGGFGGMLFGSTANDLVQHAYCPVMVVHPQL